MSIQDYARGLRRRIGDAIGRVYSKHGHNIHECVQIDLKARRSRAVVPKEPTIAMEILNIWRERI